MQMLNLTTYCMRKVHVCNSRLPQTAAAALAARNYASKTAAIQVAEDVEENEQRPTFLDDDIESQYVVKTNKSGLLPQHRNMLHEQVPYTEPQSWIHKTEKYQRKIFGRYGAASGANARICFPTQADLKLAAEKERIAYPHTLQELMHKVQLEKSEKLASVQKREEEIAIKLGKLEQWKKELNAKIAKKEADAQAAKDRKERIVEEVRRHFGFKVDPRDDRFKEMLEQKEKEHKRKDKEAKRKAKEEKMLAKLVQKNVTDKSATATAADGNGNVGEKKAESAKDST